MSSEENNGTPLSEQPRKLRPSEKVEQFLQTLFEGNSLAGGDRLPSSRAIAQQIGISEGTVRNVVSRWEREGKLEARHGSGTYVRNAVSRPDKLCISLNVRLDTIRSNSAEGWFQSIFQGVTKYMMEQGPRISLTSFYSAHENIDALSSKEILDRCVDLDGIILTSGDAHSPLIVDYFRKEKKPYVVMNALNYCDTANFVTTNTFAAYQRAGAALQKCGRKRFALFIYPSAAKSASMAHRVAGLCTGIGDALGREATLRVIDCGGMREEHAITPLSRLIDEEGYLPDAMFFSGDPHAIGAMKELARRGISVPEEVSVISGADVHDEAKRLELTSFRHPTQEIGRTLASTLVHMLDHQLPELPGLYATVGITVRKTTTDAENFLLTE